MTVRTPTGIPRAEDEPTMRIPRAGKAAYGLERSQAYEAAKRGDLPTIEINGRRVVPTALLRRQLGLDA